MTIDQEPTDRGSNCRKGPSLKSLDAVQTGHLTLPGTRLFACVEACLKVSERVIQDFRCNGPFHWRTLMGENQITAVMDLVSTLLLEEFPFIFRNRLISAYGEGMRGLYSFFNKIVDLMVMPKVGNRIPYHKHETADKAACSKSEEQVVSEILNYSSSQSNTSKYEQGFRPFRNQLNNSTQKYVHINSHSVGVFGLGQDCNPARANYRCEYLNRQLEAV